MKNQANKYYEWHTFKYELDSIAEFPLAGQIGLRKFLPLLPLRQLSASFGAGEGNTPLSQLHALGAKFGLRNLFAKREDYNPTGCFKDRESAVVVSAALEFGHTAVHLVSSGNAALSTAAYAQKAGIACTCYVPEKTTSEKVALMKLFGATVHLVSGFYEDVYRYVVDTIDPGLQGKSWNVTSGQNSYRTEGNKTIAYELWEQLQGVPDLIVVGAGNGGCLTGIWQGFLDLKALGKSNTLPKMVAVQVAGAAPLKVACELGVDFSILSDVEDSVAEGIVAGESYCSPKAVKAITESGGCVIEVSDKEILQAMEQVIELESIVPEPTTAAVYAAIPKIFSKRSNATIVCIHGGTGLKYLESIAQQLQR